MMVANTTVPRYIYIYLCIPVRSQPTSLKRVKIFDDTEVISFAIYTYQILWWCILDLVGR